MSPIKKIIAYQTTDGLIYPQESDAQYQQEILDFHKFYEDNHLLGNYEGAYVEFDNLIDWLTEHKDRIIRMLKP